MTLALAAVGTVLITAWVVGVAGAFGSTTNWTLFLAGLALLLASRVFAQRGSQR